MRYLFIICCLAGSFMAGAQSPASKITLQNQFVRFVFDTTYGGLVSMTDLSSGVDHVHPTSPKPLLWTLNFSRGTDKRVLSNTDVKVSRSSTTQLADGSSRVIFEWDNLEWAVEKMYPKKGITLGVVSVKVTVDLPQGSGIAAWRIAVDNNSDLWGLNDINFPSVDGLLQSGKYDIAKPWRPGLLYKACTERIYGDYRGNDMPMQFLCATKENSSVYMATYDTQGWWKSFTLDPGKNSFIKVFAENLGVAGSDHAPSFPAMLGVYRGGWMEGCKLYRNFATTAPWLAKGKISQRSDMPQSLKNMGLWFEVGATVKWPDITPGVKNNPLIEEHLKAQEYFGVPLGFHWIVWNQRGYDSEYPHFFPEKENIIEPTKALVAKGITIMPHINGRIADSFNEDWPLFNPYAAKDPLGKPYIELYGPLRGRMVAMCPYTAFWQDTVADLVRKLGSRLGANAAYLDQVSASSPALCFDPSHGHPLGGGHWWVDGYRTMLQKVRTAAHENGRDMMIGSEQTFEQYIDLIDGFMELSFDGRAIPMLQAVYSGYSLYFNSYLDLKANTDRGWKMLNGRSFIWAKQNGWVSFDILNPEYRVRAEYLKKIGQYRVASRKFLTYGELVGTISHPETVTETWSVKKVISNGTLPVIQGTIWKAEDGTLGVFLVNHLEEKKDIQLDIDPTKYGLKSSSGKFVIKEIRPGEKKNKTEQLSGALKRTETMGPSEIRVYEIAIK